jgi:pimeloyl-ACP methyl ester carboxylesterase
MGRYGWWNLWLAAVPVSLGVPAELDSITNAAASRAPALFFSADSDSLVPPAYQRRVIDAYAGPKHVVNVPGANHDTPASQATPEGWRTGLEWLWEQVGK